MRIRRIVATMFGVWLVLFSGVSLAQEDEAGCRDNPLFTRMPDYYINNCKERDFDQAEFIDEQGNDITVEGKYQWVEYEVKEGHQPPSELAILRNFENAIKKIGGEVVGESGGVAYLKLNREGKTFWVVVFPRGEGSSYELTMVEKAAMEQQVVADAKSLMRDLDARGHAAVQGIFFDFDRAELKPESRPAIEEVARLLKQKASLKLYVVGHTDSAGGLEYNMKLSKARADAVRKELVTRYEVSPGRLKAFGVGPLAPIASNSTDDGRAKNRRVELVKQ